MKAKKSLIVSLLAIIASTSFVVGTTYALFQNETNTNIAVTSGNIKFSAEFGNMTLYSALAEPLYDENVNNVEKNGSTIVTTNFNSVNYYNEILNGTTFKNGGTISVNGGTIGLQNISRGDKVKSSIIFNNNSNILIKYRVIVECLSLDPSLYQNFDFYVGTKFMRTIKRSVSAWQTLQIGETPTPLDFILQLPMAAPNDALNKDAQINFAVEAVQSNIYTIDEGDEYFPSALITAPTAISNLSYTGSSLSLVSPGLATGGTLKYKLNDGEYSETIPTAINAGTYTVYYKVEGDEFHDDIAESSLTVEIAKSAASCVAPTPNVLTYNGSNQNLISTCSATGGTMQYSLDGIAYSTEIPQAMNAGNYVVYYKVLGDLNHNDVDPSSINVTIAKADYDMSGISWNYSTPIKYDGSEKTITLQNLPTGVTATYTNNSKINAGDYVAHADLSYDENNYNAPIVADKSWSISKVPATCTAPIGKSGLVYSGSAQDLITAGSATGGTMQYSLDGTNYSSNIPQAINAGDYTIYYKVDGDLNHNDVVASNLVVTIGKANSALTSIPVSKELDYTGSSQALITAGSATGGVLKYKLGESGSYSESIPEATEVGTYKVYYKVEENTNYNGITESYVTSTIKSTKSVQSAPAKLSAASYTADSITLTAPTGGQGDVEYAMSTSETAPSTGWQSSNTFTSLTEGTKYYFFARFKETTDYFTSPASEASYLGMGYSVTIAFETSLMTDEGQDPYCLQLNHPDDTVIEIWAEPKGWSGFTIGDDETVYYSKTFYNIVSITGDENNYIAFAKSDALESVEFKNYSKLTYSLTKDVTIIQSKTSECIDENSLITMANGGTKAMKDIEVGDMVLSIDYDTMTLVGRKVIYTSKNEPDYSNWVVPCYYLHTFSDGTTIKRAMRHRFYCAESESYKHMSTWEEGLHGYKLDGTNPYLVSTEWIQEDLHYARITLEGSNNYFANGLSTGDSECCPNKVLLNTKLEMSVI